MTTQLLWTTHTKASTLVNVGTQAVAMQCDNAICFTDLRTKARTFYKADHPDRGFGIALLAGHNRLPLFATAEYVLRPKIYVVRYPEMTKYTTLDTDRNIYYVDLKFSEFDHLIAMTGQPDFMLCMWNIRSEKPITELPTKQHGAPFQLYLSHHSSPSIAQFTLWDEELIMWALSKKSDGEFIWLETSKLLLIEDNAISNVFSMCYREDGSFYVVNDYGEVGCVDVTHFVVKPQWSVSRERSTPRRHFLFNHKNGLILTNRDCIFFLKKDKKDQWTLDWSIENLEVEIRKIVCNFNGDTTVADDVGNLYSLEVVDEVGKLVDISTKHCSVLGYAMLKSARVNSILLLLRSGELRLVDIFMSVISSYVVGSGTTVAAHNTEQWAVVGTQTGALHFISYEKLRSPELKSTIAFESEVLGVCFVDNTVLARVSPNVFNFVKADFANGVFKLIDTVTMAPHYVVNEFYLLDNSKAVVFFSPEVETIGGFTQMVYFEILMEYRVIRKTVFQLPFKYFSISLSTFGKESFEFFASRMWSNVFDVYELRDNTAFSLTAAVKTTHPAHLNGVCGSKNLITWSLFGVVFNFRTHKRSNKPHMIGRQIQICYEPRVVKRIEECFGGKFLIILHQNGCFKFFSITSGSDNMRENTPLPGDVQKVKPFLEEILTMVDREGIVVERVTTAHRRLRENLEVQLKEISDELRELIDLDVAEEGVTKGMFLKFCLNQDWLEGITEQIRLLCQLEVVHMQELIEDSFRIRDWIIALVSETTARISIRLRGLFSNCVFENYYTRVKIDEFYKTFDLFRLCNLEELEDDSTFNRDQGAEPAAGDGDEEQPQDTGEAVVKKRKRYVIQGSAYDHFMAYDFIIQDLAMVTANQMQDENAKFKFIINDELAHEYNKMFNDVYNIKDEVIDGIKKTNVALATIFDNMNIMRRLLGMEQITPPTMDLPGWKNDEIWERIMTVSEDEIKAINRRRPKHDTTVKKSGRMLLWSLEFWVRALQYMMDGVLEKLWEEEIKKDLPRPEFMQKKQLHEYSLEDQRALRDYEERVRLLEEDRKKYLVILHKNERKAMQERRKQILSFNEKCEGLAVEKLKYDFAIRHSHLRMLTTKTKNFHRFQVRRKIYELRDTINRIQLYLNKNTSLTEYWDSHISDVKMKVDSLQVRDKAADRQFRQQYLKQVPQHIVPEIRKLLKRYPKATQKSFLSSLVCNEVATRISTRSPHRVDLPLPEDIGEYFDAVNALDNPENCPTQLDARMWETLCKMRRQKIEHELRMRALTHRTQEATSVIKDINKDIEILKAIRLDSETQYNGAIAEYEESAFNQPLQITLELGQIETPILGTTDILKTSILMKTEDIEAVNLLIREAGEKKVKAMEKVAQLRRQVLYKEWEHKVVRANMEYLKYMCTVVESSKVNMEFLEVLRGWESGPRKKKKTKEILHDFMIENAIRDKLVLGRKRLERIVLKIGLAKTEIEQVKRENRRLDSQATKIKIDVTFATINRDILLEEKRARETNEKMEKIRRHHNLVQKIRANHAQILELNTILELLRLRTYPTLGPPPPSCFD